MPIFWNKWRKKHQPVTNQSAVWGLGLWLRAIQNKFPWSSVTWEQTTTAHFRHANSSGTSFFFLGFVLSCVLLPSISIAAQQPQSIVLVSLPYQTSSGSYYFSSSFKGLQLQSCNAWKCPCMTLIIRFFSLWNPQSLTQGFKICL